MAINVEEKLREGESVDRLIKSFFKKCKKQEIIKEYLEKTSSFKTNRQKRRAKQLRSQYLRKIEKKRQRNK